MKRSRTPEPEETRNNVKRPRTPEAIPTTGKPPVHPSSKKRRVRRCTKCDRDISSRKGFQVNNDLLCAKCNDTYLRLQHLQKCLSKELKVAFKKLKDEQEQTNVSKTEAVIFNNPIFFEEGELDWNSDPLSLPREETDFEKNWNKIESSSFEEVKIISAVNFVLPPVEDDGNMCEPLQDI